MENIKFPESLFLSESSYKKATLNYQKAKYPKRVKFLKRGFLRENKLDSCRVCKFNERCRLQTIISRYGVGEDFGCNDWETNFK